MDLSGVEAVKLESPTEIEATKGHSRQVKKWMDSLRAKTPRRLPRVSIEGWPDSDSVSYLDPLKLDINCSRQKDCDALSSKSSDILGTPKTASLSFASQSYVSISRRNTQSTHRSTSPRDSLDIAEARGSLDSIKLTTTVSIENSVKSRAAKRRYVLHEILVSETNYLLGLKILTDVSESISLRPRVG